MVLSVRGCLCCRAGLLGGPWAGLWAWSWDGGCGDVGGVTEMHEHAACSGSRRGDRMIGTCGVAACITAWQVLQLQLVLE